MTLTRLPLVTLLLAVGAVLCVAELTGENVCHHRETYTISLRVVVKEPVQVRTYTWCLKVPPRCTKYKVELRDRVKVQTEVRERTVDVCCAGYASDRTETHCLPLCSGCLHGVCVTPDTCSCEPGYTGDRCDVECPQGLWGPACELRCQCQNGAICNHISGDCKCTDGWRGSLCDVTCPKGTYGHACLQECDCQDGASDVTTSCHHVTGECGLSDEDTNELQESNPVLMTTAVSPVASGETMATVFQPRDTDSNSTAMTVTAGQVENNSVTDVAPLLSNESQLVPPAQRPIIVVSDGLLSERMDEDESGGTASGLSNLVSSASVAGAVAFTLIAMATVTLLVSHRRNRARQAATDSVLTSPTHVSNYRQDIATLPLRDILQETETDLKRTRCDGLKLSFGDVSGTATTNSFGHPCSSYSSAKAYLEFQYDIPQSCASGNCQRPGVEPEHLYDEIPCWRSTTNRDISRC